MVEFTTGVWQPRSGVLFEVVPIPPTPPLPKSFSGSIPCRAIILHALGGSSEAGLDEVPRTIASGDHLLLVPVDTFSVPLCLEDAAGGTGQTPPLTYRLVLTISDPVAFGDLLGRQAQELTAEDLGQRLAQDSAVRLVSRRVLRAAWEARAGVLATGLEETLELFGLRLNTPPTEIQEDEEQATHATLQAGHIVANRWRLARKLGEGAFGEVWLAQDPATHDLERALKFVHQPDLASSVRREARRLLELERAGIDWRHLARLMDVLPGDVPCLVYEYIDGPDLQAYVNDRGANVPLAEAFSIVDQILIGLADLHKAGIIHRDLHPGNVKIDRRQQALTVKILDLGLAWPRTAMLKEDPTISALLIEPTHPYAERMVQRQGMPPDERTDLYSVGILLWWLLTRQHGLPMGQSLAEAWPEGPTILRDVVRQISVVPRDQRYASALAMAAALRQAAEELGVSSHTATPPASAPFAEASKRTRPRMILRADGTGAFPTLEDAVREAPAGAIIELGAGDYWLSKPLEITRPLYLVGEGINKTRLVCRGPGHVVRFRESGPFGMRAVAFQHEGDHPAHVVFVAGGEVDFRACLFTGAVHDATTGLGGIGLVLEGDASGTVRTCGSVGNARVGISVGGAAQPILDNNVCDRNGSVGIFYLGQSAGVARQNTCDGNQMVGIYVAGQTKPLLEANTCTENGRDGFVFFGGTMATARQNIARRNNRDGIYVEGTADLVLEGNSCSENGRSGITFAKNAKGRAHENICQENREVGVAVTDHAQPILEKNTCRGNIGAGIAYSGDALGTARENICHANAMAGITITDRAQPTLDANTCRENSASGITYSKTAAGMARGNQCQENGQAGIAITDFATSHIQANTCRENGQAGIAIRDTTRPTVEANVCEKNGLGGITYHGASAGIAHQNSCQDNKMAGIVVGNDASPTLERNTCGRNEKAGIGYIDSAAGIASENICSNNDGNGISVEERAKPTLEANICEKNANSGLGYYQAGAGMARNNLCNANNENGITVHDQGLPFLEGNSCMHNLVNGIGYRDQASGTCQHNRCEGNAGGIVTAPTARPHLRNNICQGNTRAPVKRRSRFFG